MSQVLISVLGSGTCFPVRGPVTRVPSLANTRGLRTHPGFFISWGMGNAHLLLECSQGIAERLHGCGFRPDHVRNLVVSHAHPDHFALPQFLQTMFCTHLHNKEQTEGREDSLPHLSIFGPDHVLKSIDLLNHIHFEDTEGRGLPAPVIEKMAGRKFDLPGGASMRLLPVSHGFGKVDAVAVRLYANDRIIAYSGDCGFDPDSDTSEGLRMAAMNATILICEASARVGDEEAARKYGHLNPRQAGEFAAMCLVQHLVLTHYSGADTDEAMLADCRESGFTGKITIAKDGDYYTV